MLVIPEDTGLADIAIGFAKECLNIQVDPPTEGKVKLARQFMDEEIGKLRRFPSRTLVLLRDFDQIPQSDLWRDVPADLVDRVFIFGPLDEFESLRTELRLTGKVRPNTPERIGELLAEECRANVMDLWRTAQLAHLGSEVARARAKSKEVIF